MSEPERLLVERFRESWNDLLLVSASDRLTYGAVWRNARDLADSWAYDGLRPGDSVALVLGNDIAFPCCYLACFLGGFTAVPVSPELSEEDIAYILSLADPALTLRAPPALKPPDDLYERHSLSLTHNPAGIAAIFFTSGTTGRPKGVRHKLSALVGNVVSFNLAMGLGPTSRMYHVLPMAYMAGFLNTILGPIMAGGTVILGPRFSPTSALDFWRPAQREGANTLWISPTIGATLCRLARNRERAPQSASGFETILCGTAPLHPNIRQQFHEIFGIPLQESYGTSELLLISAQDHASAATLAEHVGAPLPEAELSFRADSEGRRELFLQSPFAMAGYLTEDGLTSPAAPDGAVPTGDIGEMRDRRLYITGRLKDLIIRGGVNIAPRTIENALGDIPDVKDVAVIGERHEFWGEAVVVCVEASAAADHMAIETAVRERCRDRLARSHQPDRVAVLDAFPRGVSGKVQKHLLQQEVTG